MLKKPSEPETVEKARPPLHVLHEQLVVVAYVEIVDDGRHAYEIFSEMSHHGYASHVGEAWKAEGRVQAGVAYLESAAGDYHYLWHGGDVDEPPVVYYEVVTVATSYCALTNQSRLLSLPGTAPVAVFISAAMKVTPASHDPQLRRCICDCVNAAGMENRRWLKA